MSRLTKKYADSERYYSTHSCDEVLQKLGKLENKEEPKKPIFSGRPADLQEYCPSCHSRVANIKYCWNCGQALEVKNEDRE